MENLQLVAVILRKQLAEIEAKIAELAQKPPQEPVFNLYDELLSISGTNEWKDFINNGVVENISQILEECYDPFIEFIQTDLSGQKPVKIIGQLGSVKWQKFQLEVIKTLINPSETDEDFSDTANGCDETVWDAGMDIIRKLAE
jgi:hypothetical protein